MDIREGYENEIERLRELLRPFADLIAHPENGAVCSVTTTEQLLAEDPTCKEEFWTELGPFQAAWREVYGARR